jgi:F420-non-reducing hydrogenase large subunit
MSTHKAATTLIKEGKVTEGPLNMVEMAFRAHDPCFGCAAHSLPGQMPLEITIRNSSGELVDLIKQYVD